MSTGDRSDATIDSREALERTLSEVTLVNTSLDFRWRFEVGDCADAQHRGWFVNVAFDRRDTFTGEMGTGRGRLEFIAAGTSESGVVKTAWLLVELVVRHELMEAFHYQGKRIFNPHNSVHALASIQRGKPRR